jgi:type I restriction enzyme, S subunit
MMHDRQLPEEWRWKSLGDSFICEIIMGQSPPGNTYNDVGEGFPFFQGKTDFGETYPTVRKWCTDPRKISETGDVLISVRAPVGPTNLTDTKCIIGRGLAALRPSRNIITRYLLYALRNTETIIASKGTGSTFHNISKTALSEIEIPVPFPDEPERSLAEQRRIVARIEALLAEVREMRALHEEITADTGRLIETVLAEAFALNELENWPHKMAMGDLVEITARQVDPTSPEYRHMPHIYGATIEEGSGKLLKYNTAAEDGMTSGKYHFKAGAVLYSKIRPYLRKATIVDFDGLCSADMYPLHPKTDDLLPEFLMWSLLSPAFTSYANSLSGRARIPKLNRTQLFSYEMSYPAKEIQAGICERLRFVREEVGEIQRINSDDSQLLTQLEDAILDRAFRGEL